MFQNCIRYRSITGLLSDQFGATLASKSELLTGPIANLGELLTARLTVGDGLCTRNCIHVLLFDNLLDGQFRGIEGE